jgi:drug/metabolite transporter (DMT)-like permease
MNTQKKNKWILIGALFVLYTTWSSTYLAIRVAVETISPFTMITLRFIAAGGLMILIALLMREKLPSLKELTGGSVVGIVLFLGSNVLLCYGEQSVDSGISAVTVSSGAIWICLFSGFFGRWPTKSEWIGIVLGFIGILILAAGQAMNGNITGIIFLIVSSILWSFGSVLSRQIPVPKGFMGNGVEMLSGGLASLAIILFTKHGLDFKPSAASLAGLIYLIVIGAMVGFSAFMYVFQNARPALASSYSYVNTIGAVILGNLILKEKVGTREIAAMTVVIAGVLVIAFAGIKAGKKKLPVESEGN